jgi:hypothetical protein
MTGGILIAARNDPRMSRHAPMIVFLAAVWIVMHQQVVHGQTFNFVSHYLMLMVIAAIGVVIMALRYRRPLTVAAGAAAAVYLLAVGYDGRYVFRQWSTAGADWSRQHLASAVDGIGPLPRMRILSDVETSGIIASFTRHDVAYSIYLKNVLLTHRQIADRFCLTQLPVPPARRDIAGHPNLIYPDALSAFRSPGDRVREVAMVEEACAGLDTDPAAAVRAAGFTHVLWDERNHPEWDLRRLVLPLTETSRGDGWSLYRL